MLRHTILACLCATVAVVTAVAQPAQAGFILETIEITLPENAKADPPGPDGNGPPAWSKQMNGNLLWLYVREDLASMGPYPIHISGQTDADPVLRLTKEVDNSTDIAWTGYVLQINTSTATFDGYASSSHFGSADVTSEFITYTAPDPVMPGETVSLTFDVLVPSIGSFNVCIVQTPVPEPATLAFVGIGVGGLVLARRRRRAA